MQLANRFHCKNNNTECFEKSNKKNIKIQHLIVNLLRKINYYLLNLKK